MSSRADDLDADEASEHADESAGPRIARRIWGPVTKDVSESIGAPAAVASVQLQPRCIPYIYMPGGFGRAVEHPGSGGFIFLKSGS